MRIKLKPNGETPLYRQLEQALREEVGSGRLKPGDRLPSVAEFGKQLSLNKITVLRAYQALEREGLLASHVGRGTFVAERGPSSPATPAAAPDVARSIRKLRESHSRGLRELLSAPRRPDTLNLAAGVPSPESVPAGMLEKLARRVVEKDPRRLYEYGGPAGLEELREAIARRLDDVSPDQVIVTNGSQQAVLLLACWALEGGRSVLCETPTFTGIPSAFSLVNHSVESVPWGERPNEPRRSIYYICADFHNPTGQTLDEPARRELASWARTTDTIVVSDEIFRDLRFEGTAPPSLWSLLPPGRRVLVGSLSKTFMTGLRAGYLVADRPLVQELLPCKRYMDLGGPALTQAIAAAFLHEGYDEHLKKVRGLYRERRDAAIEALAAHMPEGVTWTKPEGGFLLWVRLPRELSSIELFLAGLDRGVSISPGPAHDVDGRFLNCFRIGYAHLSPAQIRTAVAKLADIVKSLAKRGRSEAMTGLGISI